MGCRRYLFDTNALLDVIGSADERPRRDDVVSLISRCFQDDIDMCLPVESFKDAYYITRKIGHTHAEASMRMAAALRIFEALDLCERHAHMALSSDEPDFEDGLIRAQAEDLGVDAIITDDRTAFVGSSVPSYSARECLERFWPRGEVQGDVPEN